MSIRNHENRDSRYSYLTDFNWSVVKIFFTILLTLACDFLNIPIPVFIVILAVIYTGYLVGEFAEAKGIGSERTNLKILIGAQFSWISSIVFFVISTQFSQFGQIQFVGVELSTVAILPVIVCSILLVRYFRVYLESRVESQGKVLRYAIWSALARTPFIMIFVDMYSYFSDYPPSGSLVYDVLGTFWLFPFLVSLLFIISVGVRCIVNRGARRFDISSLPSVEFPRVRRIGVFLSHDTRSFAESIVSVIANKISGRLGVISSNGGSLSNRLREDPRTHGFFQVEPPEEIDPPSSWRLLKTPLILTAGVGILTPFFPLIGIGQASEAATSGVIAYSVGRLYKDTIDGYTPPSVETPSWLSAFISLYLLIPAYIYPNSQLAQISIYPLVFILCLYVLSKSGIWYGFGISLLGLALFLSAGTLIRAGVYLSENGYVGSGINISLMLLVFCVILSSFVITTYGSYKMRGTIDTWYNYVIIGIAMLLLTQLLYYVGSYAYYVNYPHELVNLFLQVVRPFRILGVLIMLYGLYRLLMRAEELAGFDTA